MKKTVFKALISLVIICMLFAGCSSDNVGIGGSTTRKSYTSDTEMQLKQPWDGVTTATFVTSLGTFKAFLFANEAPMAYLNFVSLANAGYFNGISFHRVIKDFIVQTGDATGTGTGGTTIWNNTPFPVEANDKLHHYSGALSMAHPQGATQSNYSQFFIVATPQSSVDKDSQKALTDAGVRSEVVDGYARVGGAPYLDNLNTVFGQIYSGMDVIDAIAAVKTDENGKPETDVILESVTIGEYSAAAEEAEAATQSDSVQQQDTAASVSDTASTPAA